MNDIKDVLHLYLGRKIQIPDGRIGILTGVYNKAVPNINCNRIQVYHDEQINWLDCNEIKLILRPLSSMTPSESDEARKIYFEDGNPTLLSWLDRGHYNLVAHFLFKGFDLFGLHDKGLCLYESDLK